MLCTHQHVQLRHVTVVEDTSLISSSSALKHFKLLILHHYFYTRLTHNCMIIDYSTDDEEDMLSER